VKPVAVGGGTIGAVARDRAGHVAAATSTGGTFLKRPGRVGDSPIIGAGTYADDRLAAVSATGHGEPIIRITLARFVADRVGAGLAVAAAAEEGIRVLGARVGGQGGVIVVGPAGEPGFAFNTPAMARAWSDASGAIRTGLT
jgi:beta-aspartyl-peptidase (threonine type)